MQVNRLCAAALPPPLSEGERRSTAHSRLVRLLRGITPLAARSAECPLGGRELLCHAADAAFSRVERSPSGRPSSRARSRRRMILPLRVRGRSALNAISFGATAGPRRFLAWPNSSRASVSPATYPGLRLMKALTSSPATGSGLPMTPASATAGCSISARSTSTVRSGGQPT